MKINIIFKRGQLNQLRLGNGQRNGNGYWGRGHGVVALRAAGIYQTTRGKLI